VAGLVWWPARPWRASVHGSADGRGCCAVPGWQGSSQAVAMQGEGWHGPYLLGSVTYLCLMSPLPLRPFLQQPCCMGEGRVHAASAVWCMCCLQRSVHALVIASLADASQPEVSCLQQLPTHLAALYCSTLVLLWPVAGWRPPERAAWGPWSSAPGTGLQMAQGHQQASGTRRV
jgi:hypothetical protein